MPYSIETDNPGCARGYAVVKDSDREVMGCHATRRAARAQIIALNIAEAEQYRALPDNYRPALADDVPEGRACGNCIHYDETDIKEEGDDLLAYCRLWEDYVRGGWYCNKWQAVEVRQEGYSPNDAMVAEARRGLEWRETSTDEAEPKSASHAPATSSTDETSHAQQSQASRHSSHVTKSTNKPKDSARVNPATRPPGVSHGHYGEAIPREHGPPQYSASSDR
jgi:hypothetical protein